MIGVRDGSYVVHTAKSNLEHIHVVPSAGLASVNERSNFVDDV